MSDTAIIDPVKDKRWDTFVENHPFGWLCHLSGWNQVLENSFKHIKGHYLVLLSNDNIKAALPLFEVKSWLTGQRLVSIPFATLCDPLISTSEDMDQLFNSALSLYRELGAGYIEIRTLTSPPLIQDARLGVMPSFKHHYLLLENPAELKKKFHRTCVRQRIERAVSSDIEIKTGETESDMQEFYQLYLISRKRLGLPPQPYIFFMSLWETFYPEKRITVLLARKNDESVAGLILFKFKDRVSAEAAVYNEKFLNISPLHHLFWEAIKSAYYEGFRIFDFGRTSLHNKSLMDFKKRWGTTVVDLPCYYHPGQAIENINKREHSTSYKIIQKICKTAPDSILQDIGHFLYNHRG